MCNTKKLKDYEDCRVWLIKTYGHILNNFVTVTNKQKKDFKTFVRFVYNFKQNIKSICPIELFSKCKYYKQSKIRMLHRHSKYIHPYCKHPNNKPESKNGGILSENGFCCCGEELKILYKIKYQKEYYLLGSRCVETLKFMKLFKLYQEDDENGEVILKKKEQLEKLKNFINNVKNDVKNRKKKYTCRECKIKFDSKNNKEYCRKCVKTQTLLNKKYDKWIVNYGKNKGITFDLIPIPELYQYLNKPYFKKQPYYENLKNYFYFKKSLEDF